MKTVQKITYRVDTPKYMRIHDSLKKAELEIDIAVEEKGLDREECKITRITEIREEEVTSQLDFLNMAKKQVVSDHMLRESFKFPQVENLTVFERETIQDYESMKDVESKK